MKILRYSDSQITGIHKQAEAGTPVPKRCREHGTSSVTFFKERDEYGGMHAPLVAVLKELYGMNLCLKRMYAEERLKA